MTLFSYTVNIESPFTVFFVSCIIALQYYLVRQVFVRAKVKFEDARIFLVLLKMNHQSEEFPMKRN